MESKKRVGVITHPTITNYGGILQAYALQTVLARMGFDAEVVEKRLYPRQLTMVEKCYLYPLRFFRKKVLHQNCQIRAEEIQYKDVYDKKLEAAGYTKQFVEKNIRHKYIYDFKELKANDYFALIVGSDQIWRPKYMKGMGMRIENAFLDFARGWPIRRISYAASFGSEAWEYDESQTNNCKALLAKFDAVSCREYSGEMFCKNYLDFQNAITVLDPTMLLDSKDYESLCNSSLYPNQKGVMTYVLDKNERSEKTNRFVCECLGCESFEVIAKSKSASAPLEEKLQPPVEEWICGFRNADFVVTDSFHACVFSILFNKPFVVVANHDRGLARYQSLLGQFGLTDRMVDDVDKERIQDVVATPMYIDLSILDAKREFALSFLKQSLIDE